VAAADGARVLGVARVRGPYQYNAALRFPHFRQVEWLSWEEWKLPQQECLRTTFSEFKKYDVNRLEMERRILIPAAPSTPRASAPEASAAIEPEIEEIQRLLTHKPQIVLYGPPGTGKTYWAKEAARELASRANFGLSYKQLPDFQRRQLEDPVAGLVRTCSFHPGYGYEDFLEGYRPKVADGRLFFEEKTGIFKQLCKDAHAAESKTYYLIIDEINRGDLPRIFGELMTGLEKDKRGVQVILPVSGQSFSVPNNVFIIATMNTADRSISLLDVALRRRFGFIEILPKPALLKSVIQGLPVGPWLEAVNQKIRSLLGTDGRNLQIGHSYFMPNAQQVRSLQDFGQIFRYEVFPLLEEYCYGKYEVLEKIFGKSLVDSSEQRLRIEMFEKGREDELVHALLADFPAVITTEEAVSEEGVSEDLAAPEDSEKDDGH
jgi:5-methylcytosine-specific restriction protein B